MWKLFFTRRQMINKTVNLGFLASVSQLLSFRSSPHTSDNIIVRENLKKGTSDWQLTFVKSENYRSKSIEGYCSKTSVRSGDSLDIFISASENTSAVIDFYRMGYYGGKG